MAYSRWDRSFWFTYYDGSFDNSRRRNSQLFCIRTMDPATKVHFSYGELNSNRENCFIELRRLLPKVTDKQICELDIYMNWFMYGVEVDSSNILEKECVM